MEALPLMLSISLLYSIEPSKQKLRHKRLREEMCKSADKNKPAYVNAGSPGIYVPTFYQPVKSAF